MLLSYFTDPRFVGDKVIYSQIDMTRKTSAAAASSSAASGSNKGHNHLTVMHGGGVAGDPTSEDPLSWAPLLGNRNQPESSL